MNGNLINVRILSSLINVPTVDFASLRMKNEISD